MQIDSNAADAARIQYFGTPAERDLFGSLRGFQLHSDVVLRGSALDKSNKRVHLDFESWFAHVEDRYDWNYAEHLTVNNPDFQSAAKEAVRPQDRELTIYHVNAKRLEDAKLAAPYDLYSDRWRIIDPSLIGSIDLNIQ